MSKPLEPGVFTAIFARYTTAAQESGRAAITAMALAVERQAKQDLGKYSHRRGTPTPAPQDGPPALVSGTLRRVVTHTEARPVPGGWESRVGPAKGFYPPYPKKGKKTQASEYGRYLEEGEHPWLVPAFRKVLAAGGAAQVGQLIAAQWRKP